MVFLIVILGLAAVLAVVFALMLKGYQNKSTPHRYTPAKLNIAFQEVSIPTRNARKLYGWWIPSGKGCDRQHPVIVLVHGWNRNVERMLPYIQRLYPMGYNLLAFDSRNHGSSDRDGYSSMLKFAEDIMAAVDFLKQQPCVDMEKIGVTGLSIGGAASVFAAAQDHRIKSVITVGAFAHPVDMMRPELKKRHIPTPIINMFLKYVELKIGTSFDSFAPVNNIARADAHFLIIHGTADETVPAEHADRLKSAGLPGKVELWRVPEKGHSNCNHHPDFWKRVEEFLNKYHS